MRGWRRRNCHRRVMSSGASAALLLITHGPEDAWNTRNFDGNSQNPWKRVFPPCYARRGATSLYPTEVTGATVPM